MLGAALGMALGIALPASAPAKEPSYAVGMRTLTFVDTARPTAPNGSFPGAPTRTLPTLVLYPAKGAVGAPAIENAPPLRRRRSARFPLIVFSHGFPSSAPSYRSVLEPFVRAGYVIAAPTFPLSNENAPGGPTASDYVNQPADVSFVLTQMLRLSRGSGFLAATVNPRKVGAMGHSLGAATTLAAAANSCCLDRRIDAAAMWSGARRRFGNGSYFSKPTQALMFVHGDADLTLPFSGSLRAYRAAPAPKILMTLLGGPHVFFTAPWRRPFTRATVDFLDRYVTHTRGALRRLRKDGDVAGVTSMRLIVGPR